MAGSTFEKQIASAEKRNDQEQATQLRLQYEEQLEAWRAQQGVASLAPTAIFRDMPTSLTQSELEQLRSMLDQSQVLNPIVLSARDHFLRANAYYESTQYEEAITSYDYALKLNPDYPEAYYNRALAYGRLEEPKKAADLTEAIRLSPNFHESYYNRGTHYLNLEENPSALADFTEALRLRPDLKEAYLNRGTIYRRLGKFQDALADYTRLLQINPEDSEAHNNRGVVYDLIGEYSSAIADFTEALKIRPDFPEAYNPTFPIWLKSFLSNSSMVFQPLSNYGPYCVFSAIITP